MSNSYYSETINGRADWWQNIINNAILLTSLLPAQAAAILDDAATAVYLYRTVPAQYNHIQEEINGFIRSYLHGAEGTAAPDAPTIPAWPAAPDPAVLRGIEERRTKWVPTLKKASGYNAETNGVTLRTEKTPSTFDPDTYQTTIRSVTSPAPSQARVTFPLAGGKIDGLSFQGRKVGTTPMLDLGRFLTSPAYLAIPIATAGQAENWEICGQAMMGDTLIGLVSPMMPVLVQG